LGVRGLVKTMTSKDKNLEDARDRVLVNNSAQDVRKYLNKLFQEETRFRSRWVWELLQNARDASPEDGVRVSLVQEEERVLFRHSGLPFTEEGIAHLIYHGSTKYDLDAIGQFGTGFLTTHLISKTVTVKGRMNDGRQFEFLLDRRGENADELKKAMDASWDAFNGSLTENISTAADTLTTQYDYPLEKGIADVVNDGIADLIANAAYLLAFNTRIRSLRVEQTSNSITIEKKGFCAINEDAQRFHVEESIAGRDPTSRYVVVITRAGTSIAIEQEQTDTHWSVSEQKKTPRVFIAFPLTGTRDFCLPVVMNNEKFQPREDRDTLVLMPNNKGPHPNMILMEGACDLAVRLAVLGTEQRWAGAAMLVRLNPLRSWDWVDPDWLSRLLAERFIKPLRAASVLETANGGKAAPGSSFIPLAIGLVSCCDLWDLVIQMRDVPGRLPRRDEAQAWADNLAGWAPYLSTTVEQLPESMTLEKLCQKISAPGTLAEVEKQLNESVDPVEWLNQLHVLISRAGLIGLLEQLRLIPSQSGELRKMSELRSDSGINEELKNIADILGLRTREALLNRRMRLKELLELKPMTEDEVMAAAVQRLNDKSKSVDSAFSGVAVSFFAWIVRHQKIDKLDGFPVLTRATTGQDPALATLFCDPAKSEERLLAPLHCWPEPVQLVADLFPKRQTLSDAYYEALPGDDLWITLASSRYVRLNPLFSGRRRGVPFIPDEPLPVSEKDRKLKHRTKDAVDVSALAFFERDETGLDAVRRSKVRAVNLLLFLVQYVLKVDSRALDAIEADCECGEKHRYYPAAWLMPMWERQWVPLGDNKQSAATAETIAQLFEHREEELRQLAGGDGRKLLEALGISLADLSLRAVAKDEETRISLIDSIANIVHAADNDAEKVKLVAEEIRQSPKLLDQIREHRERRQKVQQNQSLGLEVERLLKEALREHGLRVVRTGVGSDYAVSANYEFEEDYIVDDREVILAVEGGHRSFLVEIKATTSNIARMTVTQAETAANNKSRFILCVVPLETSTVTDEIVQHRCRFVMHIGEQIEPVWKEYRRYQETKGEACTRVGDVELRVQDGEVRFAVGARAWASGLSLDDVVREIVRHAFERPD
jgi:hypothetical protein